MFNTSRWTLANTLPVLLVLKIIGAIWSLYVFLHLLRLLQSQSPDEYQRGVWQTAVSQSLTFIMLICFLRAIMTDPGSVPKTGEWQRSKDVPEATSDVDLTREIKQTGEARFCKWCNQYKPDRTHHCRVCRSCVLRMDHHCPWIANCVGFHNHKYFLLLVFYGLLNTIFVSVTFTETMQFAINEEMTPPRRFGVVYCMTLSATMLMLLVPFFLLHLSFVFQNQTTLEFCEKRSKRSKTGGLVSYNRGLLENMRAALGPYMIFWFLPIFPPEGEGVVYPRGDGGAPASSSGSDAFLLDKSQPASGVVSVKVNVKVNVKNTRADAAEGASSAAAASSAAGDEVDMAPEVTGRRASNA